MALSIVPIRDYHPSFCFNLFVMSIPLGCLTVHLFFSVENTVEPKREFCGLASSGLSGI